MLDKTKLPANITAGFVIYIMLNYEKIFKTKKWERY